MGKRYQYQTTKEYLFGLGIDTGLEEDLVFTSKEDKEVFRLSPNGNLSIKDNFAFDGATPKLKLGCLIIGAWDGKWCHVKGQPKLFEATLKHDALCQIVAFCRKRGIDLHITQKTVDSLFKTDMIRVEFEYTNFYYRMVRILCTQIRP